MYSIGSRNDTQAVPTILKLAPLQFQEMAPGCSVGDDPQIVPQCCGPDVSDKTYTPTCGI